MKKILIDIDLDLEVNALEKELTFELADHKEHFLYLSNLIKENKIEINVLEDGILHLSILADTPINQLDLTVNLAKNTQLIVYFADFSYEVNNSNVVINLNEENSNVVWHLASLASKNDKKNISVSALHNSPSTFARVDNYGVSKDNSKLVFAGTSHILNGMIHSKTHQNAKIMVFDPNSDAVAKPILKIDENDIEASHAAAVGKISDDQIFYLTSRGLTLEDARMLITLGYLKPIFKGFDEKKVERIDSIIEGRL